MIELKNISFSYHKKGPEILKEASLVAPDGACTVLTGENGAGKSTLVGILAGILKPLGGQLSVTGRLGYLPQEPSLFDDMTAKENLVFFAKLSKHRLPAPDELPFGVAEFLGKKAGELSGGMKKRLSLACTLLSDPDTLLLDEPAAALDAHYREELKTRLLALRDAGKCLLYIGHSPEEYAEFCDRHYFLSDGRLCELLV